MLQAKPEPSIDSAVLLQYKGDVLLILFGKLVYAGIRNASASFVHVKRDGRVKSVPPVSHYAVLLLTFVHWMLSFVHMEALPCRWAFPFWTFADFEFAALYIMHEIVKFQI